MNLNSTQQYYLQTMGLDIYRLRTNDVVTVDVDRSSATHDDKHAATEMPVHWQKLRSEVAVCTRCELHKNRTQTVFGVGNINADWLIIGEAPGAEEDRQGEPFVGLAGKLLNSMLSVYFLALLTACTACSTTSSGCIRNFSRIWIGEVARKV